MKENKVKGQDWNEIDPEPATEIDVSDFLLIYFLVNLLIVLHWGDKGQDDVDEEEEIYSQVEHYPNHGLCFLESKSYWNNEADDNEEEQNPHVPYNLERVCVWNNAFCLFLFGISLIQVKEVLDDAH